MVSCCLVLIHVKTSLKRKFLKTNIFVLVFDTYRPRQNHFANDISNTFPWKTKYLHLKSRTSSWSNSLINRIYPAVSARRQFPVSPKSKWYMICTLIELFLKFSPREYYKIQVVVDTDIKYLFLRRIFLAIIWCDKDTLQLLYHRKLSQRP